MGTLMEDLQTRIQSVLGKSGTFDESLQNLADYWGAPAGSNASRLIPVAARFDSSITTASPALNYLLNNPSAMPALALDFTSGTLDPRITFTRASSATYFDSAGVLQRATYNLCTWSEQFNNAAWTLTNATVSPNATAAPNGTITADKLVENTANGVHRVFSALYNSTAGLPFTASVYAKAGERSQIYLELRAAGALGSIGFNLANGTVINSIANFSASIESVGDGWFRCSVTVGAAITTTGSGILVLLLGNGGVTSYTGDGTSGLFIWGAQIEQASTAGPYWATTTAANGAPRFDYNPSTLAPLGLLIEEQRTNGIRNNTMQGAVAGTPGTLPTNWVYEGGGLGTLSQQVVGTGAVNGINYIDLRIFGTTSNTDLPIAFESRSAAAAASGQTWTVSAYLAVVGGSFSNIGTVLLRQTGRTSGGSGAENLNGSDIKGSLASAITRFSSTGTFTNATVAFDQPQVLLTFNSGVAIDITLRIGLPQLEQGAFATSVIPTTTAAATRAADNASMTGTNFSSWYNATEGTLFVEGSSLNLGRVMAVIDDGTMNNRYQAVIALSYTPSFAAVSGGTVSADLYTSALTQSVNVKLAGAYKVNDFAISANGSAVTTDTSGALPVGLNTLRIGAYSTGGSVLCGWIRRIAYFNTRLANANLQALTS